MEKYRWISATIIGLIAVTIWVFSVQLGEKKKILRVQNVANVLYCIQYALFGAFSASAMNIFSILRNLVCINNINKGKENTNKQAIFFLVVIFIFGIFIVRDIVSAIPIIVNLIYTIGTWLKDTKKLRYSLILTAIMWMMYNIYYGIWMSLIGNTFEIISGIIGLVRHEKLKKGAIKNEI